MAGMRRWGPGVVAALLALVVGVASAVAASPDPGSNIANGTETQVEAGPHIFLPSATPCVETIAQDATFAGYYDPYEGTYSPSTCPGPWSKVVLTVTGAVSGVQYDRLIDVEIGHAIFLHGSTSEPDGLVLNTGSAIQWSVQRDVTQDSALLTQDEPVEIALDNVTNATDTGIYDVDATLSFYPVSASAPAASAPNVVLPVSQAGVEPMFNLTNCTPADERQGAAVTFPRNLDRLEAELFASGGGTEEEFWWLDPENDGASSPFREIDVYIDGRLAGAATVYPSTFTGFNGPDFWEPIPSPRAWDLVPYDVDLTPFIGELSDGRPHEITLGVANAAYTDNETTTDGVVTGCGTDYWKVAANLEGWTDPTAAVTGGTVSTETNAAAPDEQVTTDPTGQNLLYSDTVAHDLTFAGTVDTGAGAETVTVDDDLSETANETPETELFAYGWNEGSTTTTPGGVVDVADDDHTYSADAEIYQGDYAFGDDDAQDDTSGTTTTFTSTTQEEMQTQDALGEGGAVAAGTQADVEDECWQYSDSNGQSYERRIVAAGGAVLSDSTMDGCLDLPSTAALPNPFATSTTSTTSTTGPTSTGTTSATGTDTTAGTDATPAASTIAPVPPAPVTGPSMPTPDPAPTAGGSLTPGCFASSNLTFPQHPAAPVRVIRIRVEVDGHTRRVLTGHRIGTVEVPRPDGGTFTIALVSTLSDGEVILHRYRFAGCDRSSATTVLHHVR